MKRHPISTIIGALDMGAKEVSLTKAEAKMLVKEYFRLANEHAVMLSAAKEFAEKIVQQVKE